MVGWRRLANIESCAKAVIDAGIRGDFVETGVLRGGSAIFMRAVLKAYGVTDRRVYACDTFVRPAERRTPRPLLKLLSWLTRIPSRGWHLRLYRLVERQQKNWPASADPSDDWIDLTMGMIRYADKNRSLLQPKDRVSVAAVKSHFARYGLLDSQVVLLEGFFADTLPKSPIEAIALLRCDGDTYESTRSVLDAVYAKVSVGGYVIIDDYNSFDDCRRAVDEFRAEHAVIDELAAIDESAVYWQKSTTP
jgi:O-methyltransferase